MSEDTDLKKNEEETRAAARELAQVRGRPCLLLSAETIRGRTVQKVHDLLDGHAGPLDFVIHGPGGYPGDAYLVAREMRRRAGQLTAFVPFEAKSAATLIALVADELVLGDLGELGPLDVQFSEKQRDDVPANRSCLERFQALDQLHSYAHDVFNAMAKESFEERGMLAEEACRIATDFAARICGPMYAKVDPDSLAESARYLEVGLQYADRLLRRYRSELYGARGEEIVARLVKAYPSHDFVIDREELAEIGVPARAPDEREAPVVDRLCRALKKRREEKDVIELFKPEEAGQEETRADLTAPEQGVAI